MGTRLVVTLFLLTNLCFKTDAQKQLIVLRNGKTVVARYTEGSNFKCVLKNRQRKEGIIRQLNDFSMITSNDTIAFQSIAKIDRKGYFRANIMRDVGYVLLLGGLIYFTADILNNAFGYANNGFDQGDRNALIAAGIGAVMVFGKSPYRRVGKRMMLKTVDNTSPFYLKVQ